MRLETSCLQIQLNMPRPDKKGISNPCFYDDLINKDKKLKSDIKPKLVKSLNNLIPKSYV